MDLLQRARAHSPWVLHYDCGSCNGCDIELLAALTPLYDAERYGVVNVGNPKHADVLVVSGSANYRNARVLRNLYEQMPDPKAVVAAGACACSGGVFKDCYNTLAGIDKVIPVDVYVPGCAARPEAVIDGIARAAGIVAERRKLKGLPTPVRPDEGVRDGGTPNARA
jgi:NADH-quinone oxidoreductase B subunit